VSDTFSSRYALYPIIFVPNANCPRYTLSITLCIYGPKNFLPCRIKKIPDLLPGHLFSIYEYIVDHLSCYFYFTFGFKRIFSIIKHKFTVKTFDSNVTTVFKNAWLYFWAAESAVGYFHFEGFFQGAVYLSCQHPSVFFRNIIPPLRENPRDLENGHEYFRYVM
jgi:hypothetical protein